MTRVLALAGAALLCAGAAWAADLPAAPALSWSGCYLGVNAGGASAKTDTGDTLGGDWLTSSPASNNAVMQANGSPTIGPRGLAGGGQVGCNWQIRWFVVGIEGDADYVGLSGNAASSATLPIAGVLVTNSASVSSHWLATVRPRLAYAAGPALLYATGGLAFGTVSYSDTQTFTASNTAAAGSVSSTKTGYGVGGGIEYAFDSHWIAGVEYLYVNLGSVGFDAAVLRNSQSFTNAFNAGDFKENIVRARVSYKF